MNNKELQNQLSEQLGISRKDVAGLLQNFVAELTDSIVEGSDVALAQLGTFEVKEKGQRVMVNPKTKERMLVPPKLTLNFKSSPSLKNKIKNN